MLINTKDTAKILGCSAATVRIWMGDPDFKDIDTPGQTKHFYERDRVFEVLERHPKKARKKHAAVNKPQFRGRVCPDCGEPVATGVYRCKACTKHQSDCDEDYIYF
jgi:predicted RNA-binding Zn-ribbon protein involved in translation (DUF1610 family)